MPNTFPSRAPHGARGLKYAVGQQYGGLSLSRPAWGAWIEIQCFQGWFLLIVSRAPHGARGLKCHVVSVRALDVESRPARGAWIEISCTLIVALLS